MVQHPFQPVALDPKPDQRKPHEERLALQATRTELVGADIEQGLRIANAIWWSVNCDIFGPEWSPLTLARRLERK